MEISIPLQEKESATSASSQIHTVRPPNTQKHSFQSTQERVSIFLGGKRLGLTYYVQIVEGKVE